MKHSNANTIVKHLATVIFMLSTNFYSFSRSAVKPEDNTIASVEWPRMIGSFDAQLQQTGNLVNVAWTTSPEINASYFTIQRCTNGMDYKDVALLFTEEGNTRVKRNYKYADDISKIKSSFIFYRLKMVAMDGSFVYSDITTVREAESQENKVRTYINAAQSEIYITLPAPWKNQAVCYYIYDGDGNLVKARINSSANQTEILNISDLPMGMYTIKAASKSDNLTHKFTKAS